VPEAIINEVPSVTEQVNLESLIARTGTQDIAPLIHGIYQIESGSGSANTSKTNSSGARGPMQVTKQTFQDLKQRGYIPDNYKWTNPQHLAEAGVANIGYLVDRFKTTDPRVIGAAYYGGPSAVNKDLTIAETRGDPKHPNYPKIGEYADKLHSIVSQIAPDFVRAPAPAAAPAPQTPPVAPLPDPMARVNNPYFSPVFKEGGAVTLPTNYRKGGRVRMI
jgi:hypothetical protein